MRIIGQTGKRSSSRLPSSHHMSKKRVQSYGESAESDDEAPLLSMEEERSLAENKYTKSGQQRKYNRAAKSAPSTRIKSKLNQPPPTLAKPPPQPVAKKRRSRRKQ